MTKVQTSFKLSRALDDRELKEISRLHAVYGLLAVRVQPSGDELLIDYDASRLSREEVRGTLDQHGIPLA
jgi:hypothetical protein